MDILKNSSNSEAKISTWMRNCLLSCKKRETRWREPFVCTLGTWPECRAAAGIFWRFYFPWSSCNFYPLPGLLSSLSSGIAGFLVTDGIGFIQSCFENILLERQCDEKSDVSSVGLLNCPARWRAGSSWNQGFWIRSGLPAEWQRPKSLSRQLLPHRQSAGDWATTGSQTPARGMPVSQLASRPAGNILK